MEIITKLEKQVTELLGEIAALKLEMQELKIRIEALESGEKSSGVFLDGAPDYVVAYLDPNKKEDK